MKTLSLIDACLLGLFSFAAIHYAIQWWLSRHERVLGVFAVQCALYAAFTWTMLLRHRATTVEEAQAALDINLTFAVLVYIVIVQFYALLGNRRDHAFRVLLVAVYVLFALVHQWVPLRGTVVDLQSVVLPNGDTVLLPIRPEPGVFLALWYFAVLVAQLYGIFVARTIWKRGDRVGALLIILPALTIEAAGVIGLLVDFGGMRSPHVGALPHAFFVLCMALFLAREYSARAKRVVVAERHFASMFERAPIGKALVALDGHLLRANPALCTMFGVTAEELCTRRLQELTDEPHAVDPRLLVGELQSYTVETSFCRRDGKRTWALLAVSAVPGDDGRPARIIAQMQDVTELREHREKLEDLVETRTRELRDTKDLAERANATKSEFLAHISHEIRTPLGVIMLYAQLLQRYSTLDEDQRKKVGIILSSGKHLLTLLSDVLEMSKIEAGHVSLVEDRFDLWAILDEIKSMFAVQAASQGLELELERAPDLERSLHGDVGKVKQILINLVGNAVKFTKQGSIRVKASSRGLAGSAIRVEIVVVDTGIGIESIDLARLFQPFEQIKSTASAGGTGLGLAISRTYGRMMHGDLTVESTPGLGTSFTFTFIAKAVDPSVRRPRVPTPPVVVPAQCKVLIVDDVQNNRDILEELLAKRPSFETRTASDGPNALALHAAWSPDLVLMDLRMPGMDGLEAIRQLRAAGSTAAIGVLTASAFANEPEALAVGADFFLRKPYDERDLFTMISRVLGTRESPELPV